MMNKIRRASIQKLIDALTSLRADLDDVCRDEEYAFGNLPENLQDSQRGDVMQDAIDFMDNASDSIGDAIDQLSEIV